MVMTCPRLDVVTPSTNASRLHPGLPTCRVPFQEQLRARGVVTAHEQVSFQYVQAQIAIEYDRLFGPIVLLLNPTRNAPAAPGPILARFVNNAQLSSRRNGISETRRDPSERLPHPLASSARPSPSHHQINRTCKSPRNICCMATSSSSIRRTTADVSCCSPLLKDLINRRKKAKWAMD